MLKYYNYVKITLGFYEGYSGYVVEQNEDKYKVYIQHHPEIDFEYFTSGWINESDLELIK